MGQAAVVDLPLPVEAGGMIEAMPIIRETITYSRSLETQVGAATIPA